MQRETYVVDLLWKSFIFEDFLLDSYDILIHWPSKFLPKPPPQERSSSHIPLAPLALNHISIDQNINKNQIFTCSLKAALSSSVLGLTTKSVFLQGQISFLIYFYL